MLNLACVVFLYSIVVLPGSSALSTPDDIVLPRQLPAFDTSADESSSPRHQGQPPSHPAVPSWAVTAAAVVAAASIVGLVGATVTHLGETPTDDRGAATDAPQGCCARCLASVFGGRSGAQPGGEHGVALVDAGYDSDDDAAFAAQCANFDSKSVGAAYTTTGMMTRGDVIGDDQL